MHDVKKRQVPADLIPVGHITGAFGVQGWVKIHPYSNEASALLHVKRWFLKRQSNDSISANELLEVEKLEAKRHGDGVVARIMGVVGRDGAEALKGSLIQISRSHFPVLDSNEYYWTDLVGLAVVNCQGEKLGEVTEIMDFGAHPILRVVSSVVSSKNEFESSSAAATIATREYLIPFVANIVPDVDQKNKIITVDWGLDY